MKTLIHNLFTILFIGGFSYTLIPLTVSFPIPTDFPAVFNFGDSNSDTGEIATVLGYILQPPYGEIFSYQPSIGRFCNGRLIVDFLMEAVSKPILRPYFDTINLISYRAGCNFAAGGSTIQKDGSTVSPFDLIVQLSQFNIFKFKMLQLIQQDKENEKILPTEYHFKNGLYMFDMGQNDIYNAFHSKTLDQVFDLIPTLLYTLQYGIKTLYEQGARNFWIHNTGPVGCLPQTISIFGKNSSNLDKFGCVIDHNKAAKFFNSQLHDFFKKFSQNYPGSRFTYVDIFSIKYDLILNHSKYGFDHPIMACCGIGGPPLNYDINFNCGSITTINGTTIIAKGCNNSSKYVNWDGIHYTEAANQFVSQRILTGNYSETISN